MDFDAGGLSWKALPELRPAPRACCGTRDPLAGSNGAITEDM
jgi:hypothetical protein